MNPVKKLLGAGALGQAFGIGDDKKRSPLITSVSQGGAADLIKKAGTQFMNGQSIKSPKASADLMKQSANTFLSKSLG